jgi:putative salt-induced outer membrane protein YdiY
MLRKLLYALLISAMGGGAVCADEVVLSNGDQITGRVGTIAAGKMKFASPVLGELLIDMAKVRTYTTDEPVVVRMRDGSELKGKVVASDAGKVSIEGTGDLDTPNIKQINPPEEKWTGSLVANGVLARGNTHSEALGAHIDAVLRRDHGNLDDRFTLGAAYNFARERNDGGEDNTTTDNWSALGKYDKFFNPKYYGYVTFKLEHDNIANLNYRASPGVGLGYQFIEGPTLNVSGEAGVSYVFEDYQPGGSNEHAALRLAGHLDKKLNERVTLFANGEYLPAFDDPGDYNLNADAGVRTALTKIFFLEFKFEFKRDSTPAPDSQKNDLRYLLGVGWSF